MATTIYGGKTAGITDRRQQEALIRSREIQDQSLEAQREANRYSRQRQAMLDEQAALDRESARGLRERQIRRMDEDSQKAQESEARKKEAQRLNEIADGLEATVDPDMPWEEVQKLYPNYVGGLRGIPSHGMDGNVTFTDPNTRETMVITPAQAKARADAHRQRAAMMLDPEGYAKSRWKSQVEARKGKIEDREMAAGLNAASPFFATSRSWEEIQKGASSINSTHKKAFMAALNHGMSMYEAAQEVGLPMPPKIADELKYAGQSVAEAQAKYDALLKKYGANTTKGKVVDAKAALVAAQSTLAELEQKYVEAPKNLYWNPETLKFEDRSKVAPAPKPGMTADPRQSQSAPSVVVQKPSGLAARIQGVAGYVPQLTDEQGQQAAAQPKLKGDWDGNGKVDPDEVTYTVAMKVQEMLNSDNQAIRDIVAKRYTPARIAELKAFSKAFEERLKLNAKKNLGMQWRK